MSTTRPNESWHCPDWPMRAAITGLLSVLAIVLFRELLANCMSRWMTEPQYSHGFVIPFIAVALIWLRRPNMNSGRARSSKIGLLLIGAGCAARLLSIWFFIEAIDSIGFLLVANGIVLLVWGRRCFRGIWPAIVFLGFMLPLPWQFEHMLSDPLQLLGTNQATWLIQTCGIPAIAQGNMILMSDTTLGVAEACSGLRMLMVFAAVSTATVIVSRRAMWERMLILASAVPIALFCNVVRIVATAIAHETLGRETADMILHDLSGWLMMPLAMLLLYLELKLLDVLFVAPAQLRPGITSHRLKPVFTVQTAGTT